MTFNFKVHVGVNMIFGKQQETKEVRKRGEMIERSLISNDYLWRDINVQHASNLVSIFYV